MHRFPRPTAVSALSLAALAAPLLGLAISGSATSFATSSAPSATSPGLAVTELAAPGAAATTQRGRSGGKPRAKKGRPSRPRGIGPNRALDATGGADSASAGRTDAPERRPAAAGPSADSPQGKANGHPSERQQKVWFSSADIDSSGWISYREASASLRFDAPNFRAIDRDRDGRLNFAEFSRHVLSESDKNRKFKAPLAATIEDGPRRRTPEQLRAAFDSDLDGAISRFEFETILRDYSQEAQALDDQDVFARLDVNGDRKLDIQELDRLASFLAPLRLGSPVVKPVVPGANTVLELFGAVEDMGDAHPPRIVGPVPPFRRLDLDNDGFVDLEDLERLEGRSFNPVRLKSVLNTLDINYDGRLSEGEFLSSMAPPKRARK